MPIPISIPNSFERFDDVVSKDRIRNTRAAGGDGEDITREEDFGAGEERKIWRRRWRRQESQERQERSLEEMEKQNLKRGFWRRRRRWRNIISREDFGGGGDGEERIPRETREDFGVGGEERIPRETREDYGGGGAEERIPRGKVIEEDCGGDEREREATG